MHLIMTCAGLSKWDAASRDEFLSECRKRTIDHLRIEAKAAIYLISGVGEEEARKRTGKISDVLWEELVFIRNEMRSCLDAQEEATKERERARRSRHLIFA
jgi:hypothetical protein